MIKLIMFPTYLALDMWRTNNLQKLIQEGAVINRADHSITYPNKDITYLGYGEFERYMGARFNSVEGTTDPRFQSLVRK